MLYYLRQRRQTLGRGMVSMLVAVWLSLAFQACVMAADVPLGQGMDADCVQQDKRGGGDDCQPGMTCASMLDPGVVDAAQLIRMPIAQPVVTTWKTLDHLPVTLVPIPTHLTDAYNPPPLLRFCILQV